MYTSELKIESSYFLPIQPHSFLIHMSYGRPGSLIDSSACFTLQLALHHEISADLLHEKFVISCLLGCLPMTKHSFEN